MSVSKRPYKGTRDLFPQEKRIFDYFFSVIKKTAESFGYEPYDGPLLESVELYQSKSGQELVNEQIYSFYDRGERWMAIRPEMTPTLARMVAQVHREIPKPIRWFSIPNLYRYERPQKGRLREHWQFNGDIFGAPEIMGEVEIFQLLVTIMKNFGADQSMFEILVNDRSIVHFIFEKCLKIDQKRSYQLYKIIDKYKKVSPDTFAQMIDELSLNEQQKKSLGDYLTLNSFEGLFKILEYNKAEKEKQNLSKFYDTIKSLGLSPYLRYDPTIVRGIDYYTGIVFEVFDKHPNNRRAICGGGAYANLLQIFDEPPLPGVGFGLGDVTFKDFLVIHQLLPDFSKNQIDLYLVPQMAEGIPQIMAIGSQLRSHGLRVLTELSPLKPKKAFHNGEKKGASFIGLLGERELAHHEIQIKNAKTKETFIIKSKDVKGLTNILCPPKDQT